MPKQIGKALKHITKLNTKHAKYQYHYNLIYSKPFPPSSHEIEKLQKQWKRIQPDIPMLKGLFLSLQAELLSQMTD